MKIADTYYLESLEQLQILADPLRYRIVDLLSEPKTGAQLARELGTPRPKIHYHLKLLARSKLIRLCPGNGAAEMKYICVARMLSFTRLLPDPQTIADKKVTAASYKAIADFLATMLDVSRAIILKSPAAFAKDSGAWLDMTGTLGKADFARLKKRVATLNREIVAMTSAAKARRAEDAVRFHATVYLTPETPVTAPPAASRGGAGRAARGRKRS
ncbi:MAG: helix-turn-helix transcriptional regulator [Alphaproteobacteria bacterium]|nr:helix-turn-helix transcriptional regulator [Alphaproteobacteria bacterium]